MSRATITQVGQAVVDTIRAGSYGGSAIRADLTTGGEFRPPSVLVTSPAIGFELLGEGYLVNASDWPLVLYTAQGREANVAVELAFLDAVMAALMSDPSLGGVVISSYLEPAPEAVAVGAPGEQMYRREIRLHIDH